MCQYDCKDDCEHFWIIFTVSGTSGNPQSPRTISCRARSSCPRPHLLYRVYPSLRRILSSARRAPRHLASTIARACAADLRFPLASALRVSLSFHHCPRAVVLKFLLVSTLRVHFCIVTLAFLSSLSPLLFALHPLSSVRYQSVMFEESSASRLQCLPCVILSRFKPPLTPLSPSD